MARKRKRHNWIFVLLGVLCLAAALGLAIFNVYEDRQAGQHADMLLGELQKAVKEAPDEEGDPAYIANPDMELPIVTYEGRDGVGILLIPSLGLELPVIDNFNYANLRWAPCRYVGTPYKNDLVICAHNYDRHFGRLDELNAGDDVIFIDLDGHVFTYKVGLIETVGGYEVEKMIDSEWDLSLFTCTYSGRARVTVRCLSADSELIIKKVE